MSRLHFQTVSDFSFRIIILLWLSVRRSAHAEFALKRKEPEFYGEIRLDSEVNIHKVSLDPIDEPVRSDALRKRNLRKKCKSATTKDGESTPTKRRLLSMSREEKQIAIAVALDGESYHSIFNIRTMRDLNKYRYERKCIELVKEPLPPPPNANLLKWSLVSSVSPQQSSAVDRFQHQSSFNRQETQPVFIILPQSDELEEETLSSEEGEWECNTTVAAKK